MTIEMKSDQRTDLPTVADERTLLTSFLDFHRDTLAWKCSGLTDEQLAVRSTEPSSMSLLGLLRHLTEVERGWFVSTIAGEEVTPVYSSAENWDEEFDQLDTHSVAEVYEAWLATCARSREITAARPLDFEGSKRGTAFSLRWVLIHLIEEYARHNGHADLIRERIDGGAIGE
jgi:uncharacterized damage-inducible protein DinB